MYWKQYYTKYFLHTQASNTYHLSATENSQPFNKKADYILSFYQLPYQKLLIFEGKYFLAIILFHWQLIYI